MPGMSAKHIPFMPRKHSADFGGTGAAVNAVTKSGTI